MLLLEHRAVYTAGKRTEPHERPIDGTPVIDVDRGGKITWHGPGQIVGYPIVRLPAPDRRRRLRAPPRGDDDPRLRRLRRRGRPGRGRAAASGSRPTTAGPAARSAPSASGSAARSPMHGFALNCDSDLSWARGHRPVRHRRRRRHLAVATSSAATCPSPRCSPTSRSTSPTSPPAADRPRAADRRRPSRPAVTAGAGYVVPRRVGRVPQPARHRGTIGWTSPSAPYQPAQDLPQPRSPARRRAGPDR